MQCSDQWKSSVKSRDHPERKKKKENRRVRKMKKPIKELRQLVARAGNEIYQAEEI